MDCTDYFDMVQLGGDVSSQCVVYDKTPRSEQKKINIVVRPTYTVGKVINDITTQYRYDSFDLVLQPDSTKADLVYLNDFQDTPIYNVHGFDPTKKTTLVLLPPGDWDSNVKKRYDLSLTTKKKNISNGLNKHNINYNNNNNNNNNSATNNNNNNDFTMKHVHVADDMFNGLPSNGDLNVGNINSSIGDVSGAISPPSTMTTVTNATSTTDSLNLSPISDPDLLSDDDLALGASASPTETEPLNGVGGLSQNSPNSGRVPFGPMNEDDLYQQVCAKVPIERYCDSIMDKKKSPTVPSLPSSTMSANSINGFVGLVNQAMTCYLNSLLQALFMTPEFRNALYRWEFDNDNEAKNIPYQLQKLFLNLQTSKKSAVETTDLTRSFGWDSTEAWQQHDIQELCRVMFDALEHKFKNTKQMNLISNLYEGKMIDYVRCLECNTEKTRADTFLDIPLPVRPFGSSVAYGSIEEALRAFVQPETLDGNNQYFCEKCNKKCDAHKGLKFKNFPYVLTLHLKRFDFDYQTMHRIKLNDKVTFPQKLNLNTFISAADGANCSDQTVNGVAATAGTSTTDDCSTTDSVSAMEEDNCSSGIATTESSSQHENDMNDDDEGIDLTNSLGNKIAKLLKRDAGPYMYELFAIMIHSGSASGGHYYAYIKEFENNEWFCFNDQTVSPITQEDIQKSFGGSSSKSYYSSVYSSSTNAYMLMYRQIDAKRNESSMKLADFPEHIKTLLPRLHMEDETRISRSSGRHTAVSDLALPDLIKPRVHFYNPQLKKLKVTRVYVLRNFDINSVLESAYQMHNVESFAPISHCRLVGYDESSDDIVQSFEGITDPSLTQIRASHEGLLNFLLEYRTENQEFEVYEPGGTTWQVYMININTLEIDGPFIVYSAAQERNAVLLHSIAVRLHVKENELLLATMRSKTAFVAHDPAPTKESQEHFQEAIKSKFPYITHFYLNVPSTDASSLELMGIPTFEAPSIEVSSDVVDAVLMSNNNNNIAAAISNSQNGCLTAKDYSRRESPLPSATGHESNSEDSSLSDGDRTLVESLPNRASGESQISSNSHSPQLSSPEDECNDSYNRVHAFINGSNHHAESDSSTNCKTTNFFSATKLEMLDTSETITSTSRHHASSITESADDALRKPVVSYKIIAEGKMKTDAMKRHIESLIRVPANYFKIQRKNELSDVNYILAGETLTVELGKVLQTGEHKAKIFFIRLSELNNEVGKLPCVCEWIYNSTITVAEAKKELVAKLHRIDKTRYQTLTLDNCRIWLKCGRSPIKVLIDEECLSSELRSPISPEFFIQQCEDNVIPQTSEDSITLFVRQWHADKLELDKFEEITLEKNSEIKHTLAQLSNIPEENIAYSRINSAFPCTNISLLSLNSSMSWFTTAATLDKYPLTSTTVSGHVYFYKDVTKAPKELSTEERRELNGKEMSRLDRLGFTSTSLHSPRRERALKIYLDSPQATTTVSAPIDASSTKAEN